MAARFTFGEFPPGSLRRAGGAFHPIGLGSLRSPQPRRRRRGGYPSHPGCLLPEVAHAHVHTAVLDLTPLYEPSARLNWPAELNPLVEDPDSETVVAAFQARLARQPVVRPAISTNLVYSSGLVSRAGARLPVSPSYEYTVTTIPAVTLLRKHPDVTAAFGRCLADPQGRQIPFLAACLEKAGLAELDALLSPVAPEHRPDAVAALYGQFTPESCLPLVIALPWMKGGTSGSGLGH